MGHERSDQEYELDKLPHLEVTVLSTKVEDSRGLLSKPASPLEHPEITQGKAGGASARVLE